MMPKRSISRRTFVLSGVAFLPSCSTIAALNTATTPVPTFDLRPAPGAISGPRRRASFVVARPVAPAILDTDRLLVRPDSSSVTYLPGARLSDELPSLLQSLIVRSISATERVAYVGPASNGPVPDYAILLRIDAFEAIVGNGNGGIETFSTTVDLDVTIVRDSSQKIIATRRFNSMVRTQNVLPSTVITALQTALDTVLPELADWVIEVSG